MQNKWLYIGVGAVVVVAIVAYLAMKMMWAGAGVGYQQNLNGSQTYSNNEGSVTVGTNAGMPSSWPADAPANYAGATILFSGDSNPQTGKTGAAVSYTVTGTTAKAVADYYKNSLTASGWNMEGSMDLGTQMVIGAKKDTRTFGASIVDDGKGTVTVTAGLEL